MIGRAADDERPNTDPPGRSHEQLSPARILLVEDDPADVAYTLDEFREHRLRNPITVLGDGRAALDYLQQRGAHQHAPRPDILLLDLNLPGVDGRVVLDRVVADPALAQLSVVVLTGSDAEEHILRDLGVPAAHFFRKPVDFAQLIGLIRNVERFSLVVGRDAPSRECAQ